MLIWDNYKCLKGLVYNMKITILMNLLGGLALFLYGMNMMSSGMEAAAGSKLSSILEKLTSNRFLGVIVGAVITALIQSSSATTVMVVGFVSSGMMTLNQAVWVIMGANIGTTITGQLVALDAGKAAPLIAFIGVAMIVFMKKPKWHYIGNIFAGLGILFIGMDMMSNAMVPFQESEAFIRLLTSFSNPVLGILAGAGFTAVIQSSSASVGILQALANSGLISLSSAVFVLFGQNIGTCITAVLASVGTSRNAKRTTIIHLAFNMIGTILFTVLCILTPLVALVETITPGHPASQIANMHTIFNIVTTLLLLPFGDLLAGMSEKILPDKDEEETENQLMYIKNIKNTNEGNIGISAIHLEQTRKEIERMLEMARINVKESFQAFLECNPEKIPMVEKTEDEIDYLNKEISKFISTVLTHEITETGNKAFSAYFKITGNIERISDHAMNICDYSGILKENDITFTNAAKEEILSMQNICDKLIVMLTSREEDALDSLSKISALEQKIDDMTEEYRNRMMIRIKEGKCSEEESILYSEMLTDFERIGDHALNISQQLTEIRLTE